MSSSNHLNIPQSPPAFTSTPTPASTPFNPRTHRHKRSQAILGDFDGLGLFNIPPPGPPGPNPPLISSPKTGSSTTTAQSIPCGSNTPPPTTSSRSSHYGHRLAFSNSNAFSTTSSPYRNFSSSNSNNNHSTVSASATATATASARTISSSAPKERVVGFADTPRTKTDEDYELDRHFHFNNKDDFANPIDHGFAFPKNEFESSEKPHSSMDDDEDEDTLHNYSSSPPQGVTYTTTFRKSLSSPIQLSNRLSHSSLRQHSAPHLVQSPRHLTYQQLQPQLQPHHYLLQPQLHLQLQELDVPDPVIDLDYILTANLHIGLQLLDDSSVFNTDDFFGSPAIAEEEDAMEDKTLLAQTSTPSSAAGAMLNNNHEEIGEQDLHELQLEEEELKSKEDDDEDDEELILPPPTHNFYSLTNSSSSSFNSVHQPQPTSSSSLGQAQPPTPSFSTPTRQRSGAKAHRYQIFYDQSNRISNAMRGSAESIERTNTNTPPLSSTTGALPPPHSPAISASSNPSNPVVSQYVQAPYTGQSPQLQLLQQQPALRKTRYLNHYYSLPTLKSKRSFSSIRYNELKKISSPTKEYYRLQSTLSPSKHNGNSFNNTLHFGNNSSNNNSTAVPIDLTATLQPPIPQCSTPSTLATQSTTESVSTAISNKREDASTSPISDNSEISSMVITDGKRAPQKSATETENENETETVTETGEVDPDSKPTIVVSTRDLESQLPNQGSASTISSHLFPIPQLGHSNDNLILLPSESTISNTLSPQIVTAVTNGSNRSFTSLQDNGLVKSHHHPQTVLAPPPPPPPPMDRPTVVQSLPVSTTSSPTSLTFKRSQVSLSSSSISFSSSPTKRTNELERPNTGTSSRQPLSPTESNFIKLSLSKQTKVKLDAPMSKYDYHKYPKLKKPGKHAKHGPSEADGDSHHSALPRLSKATSAVSSTSTRNESDSGVLLSLSLTNESKLKKVHGGSRRRLGHARSKSNVEDSLSLAGMKRSSRFFDWLRKR